MCSLKKTLSHRSPCKTYGFTTLPKSISRSSLLAKNTAPMKVVATRKQVALGYTITRLVAQHFKVQESDLIGPSRSAKLVDIRELGMWAARTFAQLSFPQIGRIYCRHHTTVIDACNRAELRIRSDKDLIDNTKTLFAKISKLAEKAAL